MRYSAPGVVVDFAELSDPGRDPFKQVNEDACLASVTAHGFLAVVCDGMGGHEGGKLASLTAVTTILREVEASPAGEAPGAILAGAVRSAGRAVYALGGAAHMASRPGSTCVALLLGPQGAAVAHVGDSRVYRRRHDSFRRLTRDHSIVQHLVETGAISAAEALHHPEANRITRALGVAPEVDVEVQASALLAQSGDLFLLCSDGLTDLALDDELGGIVHGSAGELDGICRRLVDLANSRGGHDNISVQVLVLVEAPQAAGPQLAQTLLDPHSATKPAGSVAKTLELQNPLQLTQPDLSGGSHPTLTHDTPADPTLGRSASNLAYPAPLSPERSWPEPGVARARRPVPWLLLLVILGTLALGTLLGGGLIFWWLTHPKCPAGKPAEQDRWCSHAAPEHSLTDALADFSQETLSCRAGSTCRG